MSGFRIFQTEKKLSMTTLGCNVFNCTVFKCNVYQKNNNKVTFNTLLTTLICGRQPDICCGYFCHILRGKKQNCSRNFTGRFASVQSTQHCTLYMSKQIGFIIPFSDCFFYILFISTNSLTNPILDSRQQSCSRFLNFNPQPLINTLKFILFVQNNLLLI